MCTTAMLIKNFQAGVLWPNGNLALHKEMKSTVNGKNEHKYTFSSF